MSRRRLDQVLVERGLADSRAKARAAIEAGGVTVDGQPARAASQSVGPEVEIGYIAAHDYVGRGGLKLAHALSLWPVDVAGRVVLDVGASTGGFTEVCLRAGAARVFSVDVGRDQLHPRLVADPRVVDLSGRDARTLAATDLGPPPDLIVCDVSFIGLSKALPTPLSLAAPGADLLTLVKPQFEMDSRTDVGRGGVVRDPAARAAALARAVDWLKSVGWPVQATADSPITGGDGNLEHLLWARRAQ